MDPQVSTSFIPKEALTAQKIRTGGMGLFSLIAILVFVISLVAAGGAFGYGQLMQKQLAEKKASLDTANKAFDPATIQVLARLDSRIEQSKVLLSKHVAPSGIFAFLADKTLVNVQFTSFEFLLNPDGTAAVQLNGSADSFSTVALQNDAFGSVTPKVLKDVIFSNITVDPSGRVTFGVQATVDPSLISYNRQITTGATPSQPQTAQ